MTRHFTADDIEKRNARNKAAWDDNKVRNVEPIKQSKVAEKPEIVSIARVNVKGKVGKFHPVGADKRQSKYRNVKTEVDGIQFHSKKESKRWQELKLLEASGAIRFLERQVKYALIPSQERDDGTKERGVDYVADFVYSTAKKKIVEDSKGMRTPDYVIKRKLLLFIHGITILET